MKKITLFIVYSLAIVAGVNAQNQANQDASAAQSTQLALSNAITITFIATGNNAGNDMNLVFNNVTDYANGVESDLASIKVQSNKIFTVRAKTSAANFTYSGSTTPAPVMPVNNILFIKVSNEETGGHIPGGVRNQFGALASTNRNVINNGKPGGNRTFDVQYKATPGFAYPAGTYSVDVIYTATQK